VAFLDNNNSALFATFITENDKPWYFYCIKKYTDYCIQSNDFIYFQ
jgi:hypothetical protein